MQSSAELPDRFRIRLIYSCVQFVRVNMTTRSHAPQLLTTNLHHSQLCSVQLGTHRPNFTRITLINHRYVYLKSPSGCRVQLTVSDYIDKDARSRPVHGLEITKECNHIPPLTVSRTCSRSQNKVANSQQTCVLECIYIVVYVRTCLRSLFC